MVVDHRLLNGAATFVQVVQTGSFRRAGENLSLTQSGVSRAIARLEKQLGVRLLHRHGRAVSLTDEGSRFYSEVQPLLSSFEEATIAASGASDKVTGRLRINVDIPFGCYMLMPHAQRLLQNYPGLQLEVTFRDQIGDLVADGFDVAVRFGRPNLSGLIARKLTDTRIITCASPEYLKEHGRPHIPEDLMKHECILFRDPRTSRPFHWDFQRRGEAVRIDVRGRITVTDAAGLISACVSGQGIAQLLHLYGARYLASGRLEQVLPDWGDELYPLFYYLPTRRHSSARVRAFVDFVTSLVANAVSKETIL